MDISLLSAWDVAHRICFFSVPPSAVCQAGAKYALGSVMRFGPGSEEEEERGHGGLRSLENSSGSTTIGAQTRNCHGALHYEQVCAGSLEYQPKNTNALKAYRQALVWTNQSSNQHKPPTRALLAVILAVVG